jgi:hypothetical protein
MKKLIIALILLIAVPCFAEPYLYMDIGGNTTDNMKVIILGLPNSPIEVPVTKVTNPNNPDDENYYKAEYDFGVLPDGHYEITAKAKNIWGESEASAPYPFDKSVCGSPLQLDLLLSE